MGEQVEENTVNNFVFLRGGDESMRDCNVTDMGP